MRKGQAAMEFLMTYGWAIIIVLAAIGALAYFGVLSPSKLLPERTSFPAPIVNLDNAVIQADGTVAIPFKNNKGTSVKFPGGITGTSKCSGTLTYILNQTDGTSIALNTDVSNGVSFVMTITGCTAGNIGDRFDADLTFDYVNSDTGLTLKQSGSVQGKYT